MNALVLLLSAPLLGTIAIALLPRRHELWARVVALAFSVGAIFIAAVVVVGFDSSIGHFQRPISARWIDAAGARFSLGIDGIALWLVVLTVLLGPICVAVSWNIKKNPKLFFACVLAVEASVLGVFLATDLLLFYVFWEAVLVPMYLLIGVWGYERRVYATIKFFLFTLAGGLVMLVAIIATAAYAGGFDYNQVLVSSTELPLSTQRWLFAGFALAFAVKVPIFGLHTWLPDAHTQAPTAGSVLLAGLLLKMGTFGFIRYAIPLFPDAAHYFAPVMVTLGAIGIVYGAAVSIVQTDLKRLIAYSSVSHLGFVIVGLFAFTLTAAQGATIQMVSHGISTPLLFLAAGMLYDRTHSRDIASYGGFAKKTPILAGIFLFSSLASLGLPGLNGFVGEFLILAGTYRTYPLASIAGAFGVLLAAIYLLWAYQRVFTGPFNQAITVRDVDRRERLLLAPLLAAVLLIGLWPRPFLKATEESVKRSYGQLLEPSVDPASRLSFPSGDTE